MNRRGNCSRPPIHRFELSIAPDGHLHFLFEDTLRPFLNLGDADIRRASHVDATETVWFADLGPVDGPVLGPFAKRAEALAAEAAWLLQHNIPTPHDPR